MNDLLIFLILPILVVLISVIVYISFAFCTAIFISLIQDKNIAKNNENINDFSNRNMPSNTRCKCSFRNR